MNDDLDLAVRSRQLELELDEAAGRCMPPDRRVAILRQLAAGEGDDGRVGRAAPATAPRHLRQRLAAAAISLLALSVTIGVLEHQRRARNRPVDALRLASQPIAPAANAAGPGQEPAPPAPGPAPGQDPKPAPAPAPAKDPPAPPRGTHAVDLQAVRSAAAMLEAERSLEQRLKDGTLRGFDQRLRFEVLRNWKYSKGLEGIPDEIKALDGEQVLMLGFMLPIDAVEDLEQFLLVPSLWSCCYGAPPDIHGIVRVVMPKGRTTDYSFDPVCITGTFAVEATVQEGYCVDIYQLHVDSITPVR